MEFHSLPHMEALGAGAAGPGKSVVLMWDPFIQIAVEHQRCERGELRWGESAGWALHLRRTSPMLEQTIKRFKEVYLKVDPNAVWSESKQTATFTSGYKYQFGHCKDPDDWMQYQSNEYTHISYDELIQFLEEQYDQINRRLRTDDPVLMYMLRIRAMTNPVMSSEHMDGVGAHDRLWVRRRFVEPWKKGRKTFFKMVDMGDGTKERWDWIYVPATLDDNPNKAFVRTYKKNLASAKPHIRKAMLFGDWFVTANSYFGDVWDENRHVIRPYKFPRDMPIFRSMDWGYKKPGCVHWWGLDRDDNMIGIRELTFRGKDAAEVAVRIREIEEDMGLWDKKKRKSSINGVADTQLWEKRGDVGKSKAEEMAERGVMWYPADKKSRARNAERIHQRLADAPPGETPGLVMFDGNTGCTELIRTLPSLQHQPLSDEPADGGEDHWIDCVARDTMVTTDVGMRRIRDLMPGARVLAADGRFWPCLGGRMVRRAPLYRVTMEGGLTLRATGNHPVLCMNGEWKRVDHLDTSDYAFAPWIRSSFRTAVRNSWEFATTFAANTSREGVADCIGPSTWQPMGQFQRTATSTIATETGQITLPATSSRSREENTAHSTSPRPDASTGLRTSERQSRLQRRGTAAMLEECGIAKMAENCGGGGNPNAAGAWSVAPNLRAAEWSSLESVLQNATQKNGGSPVSITSSDFALPAGSHSWRPGSRIKPPVLGSARRIIAVELEGEEETWCTQVPGMGSFVANGITVSNSLFYAGAFASRGRAGIGVRRDKDDEDDDRPGRRMERIQRRRWAYGS